MPLRAIAAAALPYREVKGPSEDASKVLAFFSLTCPSCRNIHVGLSRWSKTLPKKMAFEFTPVVLPDRQSVVGARAWYAAKLAGPASLDTFAERAYALIQDEGFSPDNPKLWRRAAAGAGIQGFEAAWQRVSPAQLERAAGKLSAYNIQATPSVVIGGRFVITPDDTNGDISLFFNLANGMVSRVMGAPA